MIYSSSAQGAPSAALGYEPGYPKGFSHFDYANPDAPKGGEVRFSVNGTFDNLNPFKVKGISALGVTEWMIETLMTESRDEAFSMYGLLAEDIALAEDKLSVVFRLNQAAKFSDGQAVTAQDVKASFDYLRSDKSLPEYRYYWGDVDTAQVLDGRHIKFHFKRVNPELHMILGQVPVMPISWIEQIKAGENPVPLGSGPYEILSMEKGQKISYRLREDYWARDLNTRKGMFNFEKITVLYYRDDAVEFEAFKAGEFDFFPENMSKRWATQHQGKLFDNGQIIKITFSHKNNQGMQGFIFNLRRDKFKDIRIRRALQLAYDFEWANTKLFYGQYTRCDSYYSNSEFRATGKPTKEELALLEPFEDMLPATLFEKPWQPAVAKSQRQRRSNLIEAKRLFEAAGWRYQNGALRNDKGEVFEIEFMLVSKGFERVLAPYAHALKKLGITLNYRVIDFSQYVKRMKEYDFDMMVKSIPQSQSPGNEQASFFGSKSANTPNSQNFIGIENEVVDALIKEVVSAPNRLAMVTAVRALDRVLLHGEYLIPNWYTNAHRVSFWDKFGRPDKMPPYYSNVDWASGGWIVDYWWAK